MSDYDSIDLEITIYPSGNSYVADARLVRHDSPKVDDLLCNNTPVNLNPATLLSLTTAPDAYGRTLTEQLFSCTELRDAWDKALKEAVHNNRFLRLRLRLPSHDSVLHALRWEALLTPDTNIQIACSERFRFVRTLDCTNDDQDIIPLQKRPVFVVVAGPGDVANQADRAIQALGRSNCVLLAGNASTSVGQATLSNIKDRLKREAAVLYLICPVQPEENATGALLSLVHDNGSDHLITGADFSRALRELSPKPVLVVIVASNSVIQGNSPLLSLGPQLFRAGIPAIVVMQSYTSTGVGNNFTTDLLSELMHDWRIGRALTVARSKLPNEERWLPILWLRMRDGRLWQEGNASEEIRNLQGRLELHRTTLGHYLAQQARQSSAYAPPAITHGIKEAREKIKNIKEYLRKLDVPAVDQLDDEDPSQPIPAADPCTNIPAVDNHFVGRKAKLEDVKDKLQKSKIVLIYGLSGTGKTRLAVEFVRSLCKSIDSDHIDAVVWIKNPDRSENYDLNKVVDDFAEQMNLPGREQSEYRAKRRKVDEFLTSKKVLLVLDDFETASDIQSDNGKKITDLISWLSSLRGKTKVLLIGRDGSVGSKSGISVVEIKGMEKAEAGIFSEDVCKLISLNLTPKEIKRLVDKTEGNPLAIDWILHAWNSEMRHAYTSLSDLLEDLCNSVEPLLAELFNRSWNLLDLTAKHILLAFTFFPTSADQDALLETAGERLNLTAKKQALPRLVNLSLLDLDQSTPPCYTAHPLAREFALMKMKEKVFQEFKTEAQAQYSAYFLEFLKKQVERPTGSTDPYWKSLLTIDRSLGDLEREKDNLFNVLRIAVTHQDYSTLVEMMMWFTHALSRLDVVKRQKHAEKAAAAAKALGRSKDEATLRIDALGWILIELGDVDEAEKQIEEGLRIAKDLHDVHLEALAYAFLTRVSLERHRWDAAKQYLSQAQMLYGQCSLMIRRRIDLAAGDEAFAAGNAAFAAGDAAFKEHFERAANRYDQAINVSNDYGGERSGEAEYGLGMAYLKLGELDKAEEKFEGLRDKKDSLSIDNVYGLFGQAQLTKKQGDLETAREEAKEALDLCRRVAPPDDTGKEIDKLPTPGHRMYHQIEKFIQELEEPDTEVTPA